MYQREAMWMDFQLSDGHESCAVKISVGGVNALTGLPQNRAVTGQQDYVVVGGNNGQPSVPFQDFTVCQRLLMCCQDG